MLALIAKIATNSKSILIGLSVLAAVTAYIWYERTTAEMVALRANNTMLQSNIEALKGSLDEWQRSFEQLQAATAEANRVAALARQEADSVRETLRKHDIEAIAKAKPGLVSRRLTDGSNRAIGMLACTSAGNCQD